MVHRLRYVRAIVHVLLLETANRNATGHSAEIPAWLSEGLAHDILLSSEMEIILPPPVSSGSSFGIATRVVNARKENPWEVVHKQLRASPPVTFQQLSWPAPEQLTGMARAVYRASSQLFVDRLLHDSFQLGIDHLSAVVDIVQVQYQFSHNLHLSWSPSNGKTAPGVGPERITN